MSSRSHLLGDLTPGTKGWIIGVNAADMPRLLEMGVLEGTQVEVMHQAPFGGDPIVIRVRETLIALRRQEANRVSVELEEAGSRS